ncbi:XdhC family protein [Nocardioides sp. Bht2]|uniref:XdhC family protein n=1 Tax=Nocardioides sp. Bht2 TaxID=3392297 RepID=UPI0039B3DFCA
MDAVLAAALPALRDGGAVGLATVVAVRGSAPRAIGASMLVMPDESTRGSVSGGCVESAVYESLRGVIADGVPQLDSYGYSDDDAFAAGLTCGGELDIFSQRIDGAAFAELSAVQMDIDEGRPVAIATVIDHPDPGLLGRRLIVRPEQDEHSGPWVISPRSDAAIQADASGLLASGENGILSYGPDGERLGEGMRVFVRSWAPRARMIVFGAIDFATAVAHVGAFLGYDVTVCDARPLFATRVRFPDADRIVVDWPHRYLAAEAAAQRIDERTVLVVLTHDAKFDVPVLELALALDVAYVGAMGSRRTHEDRLARLKEADVPATHLARLRSPIGLDLGARTPEETAISIAAEIIAARWGGSGEPLVETRGPIHHQRPARNTAPLR